MQGNTEENKDLTVKDQSPVKMKKRVLTEQGIEMRVMKKRLKKKQTRAEQAKAAEKGEDVCLLAQSVTPNDIDTMNSLIREQNNNVADFVNTHRTAVMGDPLSDRMNTNGKNQESSQVSIAIKSTFRQEEEDKPNCYLIIPWEDITLIVDSINEDDDQLKIYFGCKALKGIL